MATIYKMPNQADWDTARGYVNGKLDFKNGKYDFAKQDELLALVPEDKIISFGVADGSAMYYVKSLKPLVVCHIPFGDAYRAHRLVEKALNVTEVKRMLGRQKLFAGNNR